MTPGVHLLNRLLLAVLGAALLAAGLLVGLAPSVPAAGDAFGAAADAVSDGTGRLVAATSPTAATWLGAGVAVLVALLALAWVAVQRRGRARVAVERPAAADAVPGGVVVTAGAVEGLVHSLVRTSPDAVGASVTAVRRRRRDPRFDVVVAPRRGADPRAVAAGVEEATTRAGALLGTPLGATVRLRASAVRRLRGARRVA